MKNLFYGLLIVVITLSSCSKDSNLITSNDDLIQLKEEVQNDASFILLVKNDQIFINQLRRNEIDLFGIHNYLKSNNINLNCDGEFESIPNLKGFDKYRKAICSKTNNFKSIINKFTQFKDLNADQLKFIFSRENISLRYDCLDEFQWEWNDLEENYDWEAYPGWLAELDYAAIQDAIIDQYEECCREGGSGCP